MFLLASIRARAPVLWSGRRALSSFALLQRLREHPADDVAIITPSTGGPDGRSIHVTYGDLLRQAAAVAEDIRHTFAGSAVSQRRIAILSSRSRMFVAGALGSSWAGGCAVPIHPKYPPIEMAYVIRDSDTELVLLDPALRPTLDQVHAELRQVGDGARLPPVVPLCSEGHAGLDASRQEHDPSGAGSDGSGGDALMIYTSGTTGKPKGVVSTYENLEHQIKSLVDAWEYNSTDHILHFLPLHHVHGLVNKLLCVLWAGGTVEFIEPKARVLWQRMAALDGQPLPTLFMAVPTIYALMLQELEQLEPEVRSRAVENMKKLRVLVSGSAALPEPTWRRLEDLTGHKPLERYGMSEAGMILSAPLHGDRYPGYVGQPLPGVQARVVDMESGKSLPAGQEGELRIKGPNVFKDYYKRPEATAEAFDDDCWFKTGDQAVLDPERDSYRILGRLSADIIKRGGYKISALEIEATLLGHPQVAEAVVIGAPCEIWGQRLVAVIRWQAKAEAESTALSDLKAFLSSKLAHYKCPTEWITMTDIPKNHLGKVNKKALMQQLKSSGLLQP